MPLQPGGGTGRGWLAGLDWLGWLGWLGWAGWAGWAGEYLTGGFEVNSFRPMLLQLGGGTGRGIWLLRDVSELTRVPQWLYSQMRERGKWY